MLFRVMVEETCNYKLVASCLEVRIGISVVSALGCPCISNDILDT
uniref:Uncharacterized protein n=1 Tax=Arundo donax TaxID=35708 RepID=A0A0A8Y398_ARUDO